MDIFPINKSLVRGVASTMVGGDFSTTGRLVSSGPTSSGILTKTVGVTETAEKGREHIVDAVASIQEFVQSVGRSINFSVDDGAGRVVVKVTDADSGDVIRQIPSEEALRLAENLSEVRSLLFEAEA